MCGRHHFCSQRATSVIGVSVCMRCTGLRAWHRSAIGRRAPTSAAEQVCFAPEQLARIVCLSRLSWCDSAREWQCEQHRVHAEWQEAGGSQSATGTAAKTQVGQVRGSVPRPPDARERRRRLETGGAGAPDTVLAHSLASRAPGAGGRCHGRCRRVPYAHLAATHSHKYAHGRRESVPSSAPPSVCRGGVPSRCS
jgi:hypothetical protein